MPRTVPVFWLESLGTLVGAIHREDTGWGGDESRCRYGGREVLVGHRGGNVFFFFFLLFITYLFTQNSKLKTIISPSPLNNCVSEAWMLDYISPIL